MVITLRAAGVIPSIKEALSQSFRLIDKMSVDIRPVGMLHVVINSNKTKIDMVDQYHGPYLKEKLSGIFQMIHIIFVIHLKKCSKLPYKNLYI